MCLLCIDVNSYARSNVVENQFSLYSSLQDKQQGQL